MKSIKQSVEVAFKAIELKDAIVMVSLMNTLVDEINTYHRTIEKYLREANKEDEVPEDVAMSRELIYESICQYQILNNLGFEATKRFDSDFDFNDYQN